MAALRCLSQSTKGMGHRLFSTSEPYDVVIVGGGMVGMSLAAALSTDHMCQYLKVAVLDRAPVQDVFASALPGIPDARVSTVTPSSVRLFREIGAWEQMAPPNSCAFRHMQVWDEGGAGCLRWDARDVGLEEMGAVVENAVIQSACMRVAAESSSRPGSVEFVWPSIVQAMKLPPYKFTPDVADATSPSAVPTEADGRSGAPAGQAKHDGSNSLAPGSLAELHLEDGTVMKTRLVVAADGARSHLRDWAQLRAFALQYGQSGLVATVACDPNSTACQRFLKTGPIALLPARAGYSNIVWSTTPEHADSLQRLAPVAFADKVNAELQSAPPSSGISQFVPSLGARTPWTPPPIVHAWAGRAPAAFPLHMRHAGRYVRPRFALIGDAAHAVHPLAGQGVNLGFGDVSQLCHALSEAVRVGRDVGDILMLQDEYERQRMAANTTMMAGLHTIQQFFRIQSPAVAGLRNLGMGLVNAVGPVKNNLMRVAMGDVK